MKPPYAFGLSQEDERTEAAGLSIAGRRLLSLASAGDMALSLLALGASQVVAVDVSAGQLRLGELKLAASCHLERDEAIRFLGFLPATAAEREAWLDTLLTHLAPTARDFWRAHREVALQGAISQGRYERYVRTARTLARPLTRARFARLVECDSVEKQRAVFARDFDGLLLRSIFRVMFSPRLYGRGGIDAEALRHRESRASLGDRFFDRFRSMCVDSPARENHLLQFHLLGRVRDGAAVPEYLTARGCQVLRERAAALSFVQASVQDFLAASPAGRFDAFHLSNVTDWLSDEAFEELLRLVADRAAQPARVVWRCLHRTRPIPDALARRFTIDRQLGNRLQASDRFPVYGIVVGEVTA